MQSGWGHGGPPGGPPGGPGWGGGAPPGGLGYAPTAAVPAQGYGPAPQPQYGPPPVAAPSGGGYEFNPAEDHAIGQCASRLMFAGCMQIVFGALQVIGGWVFGVGGWLVGLPGSIALIVIGALFVGAAGSFKRVTETRG